MPDAPKDDVRDQFVEDLARDMWEQARLADRSSVPDPELYHQRADQVVKAAEARGYLALPVEPRRFKVKVDDPEMNKVYEYEIEAPTAMSAICTGVRLAILEDPGAGQGGEVPEDERTVIAEDPQFVEEVGNYTSAIPIEA